MTAYERLFARLNEAGVRYVVVGGVAVVLHGYRRLTEDVDLVIDAPVDPMEIADAEKRAEWIRTKNMTVFSMRDERNLELTVDLFMEEPIPFGELSARAIHMDMEGTKVPVASIADIIVMKRRANRALDRIDIEKLEAIERESR